MREGEGGGGGSYIMLPGYVLFCFKIHIIFLVIKFFF